MIKIKKAFIVFLAMIMLGISVTGCSLIEKSPEAIAREKVAKVGKEYIIRAELNEMVNYVKERIKDQAGYDDKYFQSSAGQELLNQIKKQVLDDMINQKILEQKSKELKLFKDENEINSEVTKTIDTNIKQGKSDEDYKKWLDEAKLTSELLNKFVRQQVIEEKVYENVTKDITVTDDEIKNYYNMNQIKYTEKPDTMEVSHILLNTEDEAKNIKERLDKGEDFATLAKQYSTDTQTKDAGGSLGEIQYDDPSLDSTFMLAALALKEGQISSPVHTQFGYHIIKVTKKNEYPVLPLDNVKEEIRNELIQTKKQDTYNQAFQEWKDKAGVKILDKSLQ